VRTIEERKAEPGQCSAMREMAGMTAGGNSREGNQERTETTRIMG
jgi:hypothetical protein